MIMVQAFMFVIPSIICGYFFSYLVLWYGYKYLFKADMDTVNVVPGAIATI